MTGGRSGHGFPSGAGPELRARRPARSLTGCCGNDWEVPATAMLAALPAGARCLCQLGGGAQRELRPGRLSGGCLLLWHIKPEATAAPAALVLVVKWPAFGLSQRSLLEVCFSGPVFYAAAQLVGQIHPYLSARSELPGLWMRLVGEDQPEPVASAVPPARSQPRRSLQSPLPWRLQG